MVPLTSKHEDVFRGCPRHHRAEVEECRRKRVEVAGVWSQSKDWSDGSRGRRPSYADPMEAAHEVDGPSEEHSEWTDVTGNKMSFSHRS